MNQEIILKRLNKELNKAIKQNEVPVAALITYNNKIIASAHNKVNKTNNILNHAEILVLKKASKKIKNWRLNNCILHITLEPCAMCKEIIKKFRIKKVIYYTKQNKYETEKDPLYNYIKNDEYSNKLKKFFNNKR